METRYDVVVVGGGHAGCEAAAAAARCGASTAMVTLKRDQIGRLSCNPAIGGLAKGHLVRELDALGGLMAKVADESSIQFRRLNTRKGLAVQASRAQVDIAVYPAAMRRRLAAIEGLVLVEGEASAVRTSEGRVSAIELADGRVLHTNAVILTTGTFLDAVMHRGTHTEAGGRIGDSAATALAESLAGLGLKLGRLKTGTVPRLDGRTIDWDALEVQEDTVLDGRFSFTPPSTRLPQIKCHIAYTNEAVHTLIRENLHTSAMYSGAISGTGPRYCPSVEDKIARFPEKERHLLFLEPEGLNTDRVYINGLSTSLPADVQDKMVRMLPGLENVEILQHGYAVEYDFCDPTQLGHDLQLKQVAGLFLAGQVNGTSGYEEAAAQGFVAGVSAATGTVFHVKRSEGYLGVLIDDLVQRGVGGEPYRMFTSRAEHRLLLREDNADRRLMPLGRAVGLIDDETWERFQAKIAAIEVGRAALRSESIVPGPAVLAELERRGLGGLKKPSTAEALLRRPAATYEDVRALAPALPAVAPDVAEQLEIDTKYEGYIARARRRADAAAKMESTALPEGGGWLDLPSLSTEVKERIAKARPTTLGQLGRLPGVTPAAVDAVAGWLSTRR